MKRNLFRRTLALLLSLAMLISVGTLSALADGETTPSGWWSAYATTSWYNDTSTTFTLTTAEQLAGLAELVNAGNTFANKTIRLGKDIDLSAHYWVPIGGNRGVSGGVPTGYSFAGTFDGGRVEDGKIINYSITGLHIQWNHGDTRPDDGTKVLSDVSYGGFGLFGKATGTIENVTISGSITSNATVIAVGGVVGYTTGNLYNCNSQVTVQCSNTASAQIGGVAGEVYNHAIRLIRHVQYCVNTGAVTGGQQVGGIVGEADCYPLGGIVIDNCANTGNITTVTTSGDADVGGIVGFSEGFLTNSYSIATMTSSGGSRVAGLVGQLRAQNPEARVNNCYTIPVFKGTTAEKFSWIYGTVNSSNSLPIKNVLWCDAANTSSGVSGVTQTIATGNNQQGYWTDTGTATNAAMMAAATGLATVYSSTGTTYTTDTTKTVLGVLGNAFTVSSDLNNGYPVLDWEVTGLTTGKEDDTRSIGTLISGDTYTDALPGMVYTIYNATDMNTLAGYVNAGKPTEGVIFRLMNDIDLSDTAWAGIGNPVLASASTNSPYVSSGNGLDGVLDGNGKTVTVSRSATTGGIGGVVNYLMPAGTVVDLTVSGSVTSSGSNNDNAVGGVVGYNSGTIDHVTNQATVTADDVYNVGGIAGFNDCCYTNLAKGIITNCRNTGAVTGYSKVGGIAGENAGTINACSNGAEVKCNSRGRSGAGGIVGRNGNNNAVVETGIVTNCYNTGAISNTSTNGSWVGGICGFDNSLSTITNCYNIGAVSARSYKDAICGGLEGTLSNCYYLDTLTGLDGYDNATKKTQQEMQSMDFAKALNGGAAVSTTTIWQQTSGQYPTLLANGNVQAVTMGFTIQVTQQPQLHYTAGDVFNTTNMKIEAVYDDGTVADVTGFKYSPSGTLTTADTSASVYGVYQGVAFCFPYTIAVTSTEQPLVIYVKSNGSDSNNGTTADTAVATLGRAIALAGSEKATVYVMDTITIDGERIFGGTDAKEEPLITVKAGANVTGTDMFQVKGSSFLGSLTIDGTGFTNTFSVTGSLAVRNNAKISGSDTAFQVAAGGKLTLNRSTVSGNTYCVKLAAATDTTDAAQLEIGVETGQTFSATGTIYLAEGTHIVFTDPVPCALKVECDYPRNGLEIAAGGIRSGTATAYQLTDADTAKVAYVNDLCTVTRDATNNQLTLTGSNVRYLNGTLSGTGDGSYTTPWNDLASALSGVPDNGLIIVLGTTALPEGTYSKTTTIQRGAALTDAMFTVSSGTVTLSGMTINGNGIGTIANVTGGTLTLNGGVTLTNCATAVNLTGGNLTVTQATINGTQYSVYMGTNSGTFTLTPATGTSISGTVYLGSGKVITVGSTLDVVTGKITIECSQPVNKLVIAETIEDSEYEDFTSADAAKLAYITNAFTVAQGENSWELWLVAATVQK